MANPEHGPVGESSTEKYPTRDLERAPEIIDKQAEISKESKQDVERNIEKARNEAEKASIPGREISRGEQKQNGDSTEPVFHSREASYKHTMKRVQAEMSAPQRVFSKVIHNKKVERVSEVVGDTVARPDAILSGSFFAAVVVLGLYIAAKYYGFSLSGFETIGAFVIGWVLGILFDFLRSIMRRGRH